MADINRTLAIVKQLSEGKTQKLPNGQKIAMGVDMSIGFVMYSETGDETIGSLSAMDLRQLDQLLTAWDINSPLPMPGRNKKLRLLKKD